MSDIELGHKRHTTYVLSASSSWPATALAGDALSCLAFVQLVNGFFASVATLAIYTYWGADAVGARRLVLVCLVRFGLLTLVGLVSYEAFARKSRWFLGLGHRALCRAAFYLQLLWFSSELLLGSALILLLPIVKGSAFATSANPTWGLALSSVFPICYIVGMTGCLCFLSRLSRRRHSVGTPLSDVDSCSSSGTMYLDATSAPSPVSTLEGHVTCEVVLVEHPVNANECVLFVHKNLRPIKTRPEDYKPILKEILKPKAVMPSQQYPAPVPALAPPPQQGGSSGARSIRLGV